MAVSNRTIGHHLARAMRNAGRVLKPNVAKARQGNVFKMRSFADGVIASLDTTMTGNPDCDRNPPTSDKAAIFFAASNVHCHLTYYFAVYLYKIP
ncbi:MAG: hypothetical protein AAF337_03815 [Pseudomonadota bacterium]